MCKEQAPRNNEPCPVCKRWNNRAVAVDIVAVQDNKVLLILRGRAPFEGYWALPGGHVEHDENALEAACRELLEETGVTLLNAQIGAVSTNPDRDPKQTISIAVTGQVVGSPVGGDDALDAKWWPLNDLPPLAFDHDEILKVTLTK